MRSGSDRRPISAVLVVVPAHDEEERLPLCLASVALAAAELTRARRGIVVWVTVVLDGCTDATASVEALDPSREPGVLVVTVDVRSVGAARRAGVQAAVDQLGPYDAGRVLLVNTDADSVVPSSWLVDHVALATDHDLVLGEVDPDPAEIEPAVLAQWWDAHPVGRGSLHGANLSVRLDAYLDAGGFADVGVQEDVLLVRALRARGAAVVGGTRVRTSGRLDGRTPGGFAAYLRTLSALPVAEGTP